MYSASVRLGGDVIKVKGVGFATSVPRYTSGVYKGKLPMRTSLDASIPLKNGILDEGNRLLVKLR